MAYQIFPALVGQGWPKRRSLVDTDLQMSASGKEVRIQNYPQPRYHWTIPFGYLNDNYLINATTDWQIITGFFDQMLGKTTSFLFTDIKDCDTSQNVPNPIANPIPSTIGIGDGTTTTFQLARVGSFGTPHLVTQVNSTNRAPRVYINGVLQSSGYTISASGIVTFSSAPPSGSTIAWDGQFYFLVRFDDDEIEATNVAGSFWVIDELHLIEDINLLSI